MPFVPPHAKHGPLLMPLFAASTLCLLIVGNQAAAGEFSGLANDFSRFAGEDIQILTPSQCQAEYSRSRLSRPLRSDDAAEVMHTAKSVANSSSTNSTGIFDWTPTASPERAEPSGCDPDSIETALLANRSSAAGQADALRDIFSRCESRLTHSADPSALGLVKISSIRYDICSHPNIRKVIIRTPSGEVIRGLLALKPDTVARPFVIMKCGIFCNTPDVSQRFMLMHLFDESPFNVLALANGTGADYVRDNGYISLGGFTESQQLVAIAKMLRASPLAARISTIHFVGVSLGAQSGLFASYMNAYNTPAGQEPLFASTFAACPVVDLEASMRDLFTAPLGGQLARHAYSQEVLKVLSLVPGLSLLLPQPGIEAPRIPDEVAASVVKNFHRQFQGPLLPPFENVSVRTTHDFWNLSNFLPLARTPIATPTLIVAAEDDLVLDTDHNSNALARILAKRLSKRSADGSHNIGEVTVQSGNHCAFSVTYGWRTVSSLVRGFVLSHSPEMTSQRRSRSIALPSSALSAINQLWPDEQFQVARFEFKAGLAAVDLTVTSYNPYADTCGQISPALAPLPCFRKLTTRIPFAMFSDQPNWARRVPVNQAEAEALTRWANVRMSLVDAHGRSIVGTSQAAAKIRWISYAGQ